MSFILYLTVGTSPIDIIWLFNNKEIKNSNAFKYVSKGDIHSLVIDEIFPEDAGIYICEAYNDFGDTDTCCKLKVKELPSLQSKTIPPTIQEKPASLEVDEGSNVKFTCIINGNPTPSIEWEKDSRKVISGARIKVVNKENHYTFEIPHALSTDAGSYTVIAKNSAGEAKCDFSLKVKQLEIAESNELQKLFTSKFGARRSVMNGEISQKPQFLTQLLNRTVKIGSCVVFDCRVIGVPLPQITWYLNTKEIKESKFFKMNYVNNKAELRIEEAYSEDEGEYECRATNKTGEMFSKAKLTIKKEAEKKLGLKSPTIDSGPDSIAAVKGKPVTMKICFAGSPDPVVMWYKDSKELKGSFKMPIKTYKGISELTLNSVKPEDAGRYIAIADNSHGSCKRSISLSVEDVPEPPAGKPSISDITEKSVTLSWSGPCYDGGAAISGYNVEICKVKNNTWKTVLASCHSTSCIIKNLEPQTEYMFRIRAENSHGLSVPGQQSNIVLTVRKSSAEVVGKQEESPKFVNIVPERDIKTHYNILEEVGKGRFGTVHRCVEKSSGKVCAAKFLQCPRGSDRDEALRELKTMNELYHGALLRLVDAFEASKEIIILTEYIPGGELFERVVADDFVLTEKDCIMFMRQICEGVQYMHSKSILHLDLKPENILCITKDGNQIKIVDFGLARKYDPKENIKIMFGTPEFVAPEVIGFEPIGFSTDMWSTGVICYILLSGLSPFLGDNDQETFSNVTACDWDFEDETFLAISNSAKDFMERLLVKKKESRNTVQKCLEHRWLVQDARTMKSIKLSTDKHKKFLARRKWQKTGNAIRALGRMASLRNSISTALSSPSENNNLHHVISEIISVQKEKNVLAEETTNKDIELPNVEAQVQKSPRFLQEIMKEVDVVEGSAVKYQVKVSGTPEPDVDWYKDGELIQEDRRHKIEYEDDGIWSLIILEVEEDDEGDYECHARNPHGKASCKSELFVLVPGND